MQQVLETLASSPQGRGIADALSPASSLGVNGAPSQTSTPGTSTQNSSPPSNLGSSSPFGFGGLGFGGAAMPNYASLGQTMGVNPSAVSTLGAGIGAALGPVGLGLGALNTVGNVVNTTSNLNDLQTSLPNYSPSFFDKLGGYLGINSQLAGTPSYAQAYGASQVYGGMGMPATIGNPGAALSTQMATGPNINGGMQSQGPTNLGAPSFDSSGGNAPSGVSGGIDADLGGLY
jgi:hypothetical protein